MYLPGSSDRGHLAHLMAPATWPGGERRIACRVSYDMTRVLDGAVHVWCVITARKDPHKAYGDRFFVPESMIEVR
jgi:hypothetical protein